MLWLLVPGLVTLVLAFAAALVLFPCRLSDLATNGCFDSIPGSSNTTFVGGSEAKRYEDVVDAGSCGDQSRDTGQSKLIHWRARLHRSRSN